MTTTIEKFSPHLLNDFTQLKRLFSGKRELLEIKKTVISKPKGALYYNRWQIVWILSVSPFKFIFYVFTKAIASLFDCLNIRSFANHLHLKTSHLVKDIDHLFNQWIYGKRFITPALNDYQIELSDVYNQNYIERKDLTESKIQKKLHFKLSGIQFNKIGQGLCHGGMHWFNYLFLKSLKKNQNKTITELAQAVAKPFEEGQPRQAALIQIFYGLQGDLLDKNEEPQGIYYEETQSKDTMDKIIQNLKNGIYNLQLPKHSVSYIKYGQEQLIWDPNVGLIIIEKIEDLLEVIHKYTDEYKEPIFFAFQSLKNKWTFRGCSRINLLRMLCQKYIN